MNELLLSGVIAWPIFGILLHLLVPKFAHSLRIVVQSILVLFWTGLNLTLLLFLNEPIALFQGNWPAPFAITLVFDSLSCLMLVIFSIVATCVSFYSYQDQNLNEKRQVFYAGFWLLLLGISGALLTADLFNLYVWFEVMLTSAFIILVCEQKPKTKAIFQYALMNILGTLLMLLGVALLYGALGTLNYASIATLLASKQYFFVLPLLSLIIFAMGLKGAVFPLYFWLPKAYPKTSVSSTLLLSSLITKVVMVVLLRFVWLWPLLQENFFSNLLLVLSLATMFFGVTGAASLFYFKDILAFHIISQLGYVLLAIVLPVKSAIVAALYFLIHNIFVKTNLFMVAGIIEQDKGTGDLKKLGQLLKNHKVLATLFFLAAFSLAGFPPLSGFWGKLFVIQSALISGYYVSAAIAIIVSLLTLYSMIKIWHYVFCEPSQEEFNQKSSNKAHFKWSLCLAVFPLALLPLIMGLYPDSLLSLLNPIATQLVRPEEYIQLILGRF